MTTNALFASGHGHQAVSRSARILLAEDNPMNAELATIVLEQMGYQVDVATDGEKAVTAFRQADYDLVLMDVQMPTLDGIAATRLIRALEAGSRHTPIIAMTANALAEQRSVCVDSGMDDFFPKPIRIEGLRLKIVEWLNMSHHNGHDDVERAVKSSDHFIGDDNDDIQCV